MKQELVARLRKNFEESAHEKDGVEYWLARDLQTLLDYSEWRNFVQVIEKAKIACRNSGQDVKDHFVDVNKMIELAKGATKEIGSIMLTQTAAEKLK